MFYKGDQLTMHLIDTVMCTTILQLH